MFQSVENCLKLQPQNHATFDLVYANSFNLVRLLSQIVWQENSSTEPWMCILVTNWVSSSSWQVDYVEDSFVGG